jgi:hypothetical protein
VFEFYVQVQGDVGTVDPAALVEGAHVALLDFGGQSPVLFAVFEPV